MLALKETTEGDGSETLDGKFKGATITAGMIRWDG